MPCDDIKQISKREGKVLENVGKFSTQFSFEELSEEARNGKWERVRKIKCRQGVGNLGLKNILFNFKVKFFLNLNFLITILNSIKI